jgi:hypothetical protein
MSALQVGNAQLIYIVGAVLALAAFARGHHPIGGLLLALAIVGKMFPAVLLVYLALRRDWRAVGWTAAWTGLLVIVTIADVGWAPFPFFLDHLPGLLSGEAFPMLRRAISAANNMSVPGLVLKLPAFGGPQVPFEALKYAGWVYTVVVIGVVAWLARRPVAPRYEPLAWLAVLGLTALRSPFITFYGAFPGAPGWGRSCWPSAGTRRAAGGSCWDCGPSFCRRRLDRRCCRCGPSRPSVRCRPRPCWGSSRSRSASVGTLPRLLLPRRDDQAAR